MPKPLQGLFFRDINNDYVAHIIKEIWFDRVYDPYFTGRSDLTVVDIGANVGLFTYYAAPFSKRVVAIEPSAQHFETLTKNIGFNGLDNVTAMKVAIGNTDGEMQLYHNENTTMFSLKAEVNGLPDEAESVTVLSLESLFATDLEHVDILKIDCEGSEAEIFGGAAFEKVADRIDLILGEYHTWCGVNPLQFKNSLVDRGFEFEWLNKTEASVFMARRIK